MMVSMDHTEDNHKLTRLDVAVARQLGIRCAASTREAESVHACRSLRTGDVQAVE